MLPCDVDDDDDDAPSPRRRIHDRIEFTRRESSRGSSDDGGGGVERADDVSSDGLLVTVVDMVAEVADVFVAGGDGVVVVVAVGSGAVDEKSPFDRCVAALALAALDVVE